MSSLSLQKWQTTRRLALDEIENAHRGVGGATRGRRYATQQINQAYAVLLSSQFQGFCRDLHSECVDYFAGAVTPKTYHRYRLPVMHTETNLSDATRSWDWLWKQWMNLFRLRADGVPIVGFTWYSLTDQVDWDTALRENAGRVNPVGLYDIDRNVRRVGLEYQKLIRNWGEMLPTGSKSLELP